MSDADLLRDLLAGWARGDFSSGKGIYEGRGPAGVRGFMEPFLTVWDHYSMTLDQLEELGDGRFLAAATQYARGTGSGTETRHPAFIALRMADGQIAQLRLFFTREEALAALDG